MTAPARIELTSGATMRLTIHVGDLMDVTTGWRSVNGALAYACSAILEMRERVELTERVTLPDYAEGERP
jgi:hypothetical protein